MKNLEQFIIENRFRLAELQPHHQITRQDFEHLKMFHGHEVMRERLKKDELKHLGVALMLGGHMSESATDDAELFSQFLSILNDSQWEFALRFSPFSKVKATLQNLDLVLAAMEEASISINAALAGMAVAFEQSAGGLDAYKREQFKATGHLLSYCALYSSYVDVCRRIRQQSKLSGVKSYDRAILRLINRTDGLHAFIKQLRNVLLHYQVFEPSIEINFSDHKVSHLYLKSSDLLYSGFGWNAGSRTYLQRREKLDVIEMITNVTKDVRRLVSFHHRLVEKRLSKDKFAYDTYVNERLRHNHLQKSKVDISGIFGRAKPLIERLIGNEYAHLVLSSSLSDNEVEAMLLNFANLHKNLPNDVIEKLSLEIQSAITRRLRHPVGGSYLQGQKIT